MSIATPLTVEKPDAVPGNLRGLGIGRHHD
jgi:hypothetical protein